MPLLSTPIDLVPAGFGMPAGSEYLIILVVALLLFGKRLPEIMRGLGSSVREFKKGMDFDGPRTEQRDDLAALHRDPPKPVDGAVSREPLPRPEDNHPSPPKL